MPIDPSAVGAEAGPVERSWTSKDALLYALGVGAGTGELAFTTENTAGVTQQVLPTFAVVAGGATPILKSIGDIDWTQLVHGEQEIELHGPLPVEATVSTTARVTAILDKGKGALVATESTSVDVATGRPLFTNRSSVFIRGAGGFGGERGPSGPKVVIPERAPDHVRTFATSPDQALLYRLSGDRNPLHSDPGFAARAGFDRPILHGLCTYGFTGRALLHDLCGGDPGRFRLMAGRFSAPVFPGEELSVSMWDLGSGEAVFTTTAGGDRVVLDQGRLSYAA